MNKEDKYSLGYVICSSIELNKQKILKLENQLKRCKNKNKRLKNNWNELKVYLLDKIDRSWKIEEQCYEDIYQQMQELEKGENNEQSRFKRFN